MSKIPSIIEQQLRDISPRDLDEKFLSRLADCAAETFTELSAEEIAFESSLREFRPRAVKSVLVENLQVKIGDTPFAVDEKIVLFNKPNQVRSAAQKTAPASNIFRFNVAAAAAVAILGSITALMLPTNPPSGTSTDIAPLGTESTAQNSFIPKELPHTNFAPTSFDRNLNSTDDQGVIWQNNTQPYRVLLHTFMDRITTENENGDTIQIEQPTFEYSLIPEKID